MILTYHEIEAEKSGYRYGLTRRELEEQLKYIAYFQKIAGIHTHSPVITFDDGHLSAYQHALPLLENQGLKAVFFVLVGWTQNRREYMTWRQLREIAELGHTVQSHGWSHRFLTHCSNSELENELLRSKRALEDHLGLSVDSLSVPGGRWDTRVVRACARAGYRFLYTSNPWLRSAKREGIELRGRLTVQHNLSIARRNCSESLWVIVSITGSGAGLLDGSIRRRPWMDWPSTMPLLPSLLEFRVKILQLISSEGKYGAETMLLCLVKSLALLGHENVIGVFRNSHCPHTEVAEAARLEGLKVEIIPCDGKIDRRAVDVIRHCLQIHSIDLVHTHGYKANFYGYLAARGKGVPAVATYHLDWPDRGLALRLYHLFDRLVVRRFGKIAAVSEAVARSLRRSGVPSAKIVTI